MTSGAAASTSAHSAVRDFSPARPEDVDAAGHLDHLRHPVAADEDRVQPLQRQDRDRVGGAHRVPDVVQPLGGHLDQLLALVGHAGGLGQPRHVGQHLADGGGVQRDHLGPGGQPVGHRAARRRRRRRTRRTPPGSRSAPGPAAASVSSSSSYSALPWRHVLAHGGVDLGCRQALGDHAPRSGGAGPRPPAGGRTRALLPRCCRRGRARRASRWRTAPVKRFAWRERWHV